MTDASKESFYVVSMGKFSALFFCTSGAYGVYWFYRMFCSMEAKTERNLFPLGRALFSIFFVHGAFNFVRSAELGTQHTRPWQPNQLAWVFIGAAVFRLVLGVLGLEYQLGQLFDFAVVIVALLVQFYVLYQVQLAVNRIASDPFGRSNARMDGRNKIWLAVGAYIWASYFFNAYHHQTKPPPTASENGAPAKANEPAPPLY